MNRKTLGYMIIVVLVAGMLVIPVTLAERSKTIVTEPGIEAISTAMHGFESIEGIDAKPLGDGMIYVDDDGICGGNLPCHLTIQEGVDVAMSGDTVYVYAGNYVENVNVDKSISLVGEYKGSTMVVANDNGKAVIYAHDADYIIIKEFTVSDGKHGILVDSSHHTSINHNKLRDNYYGIYLKNSDNLIVEDNWIYDNERDGIYAYSTNAITVQANGIYSNGRVGLFINGFIEYPVTTTLTNIIVSNNSVNANSANGIQITGVYGSEIYDNTVNSNYRGIFLTYSDNNNVHDNTVQSNSLYGIAVHKSDENTIYSNTATHNDWNIYTGLVLTPNLIYNNYFANAKTKNYFLGSITENYWNTNQQPGPNIIGGQDIGGNYWDDYTGSDTDGDGIGETPYILSGPVGQGVDYLPLTNN